MSYWPSMSSRWLDIGLILFCEFIDVDFVSVHKHAKEELGQYPAILTSHLVNNSSIWRSEILFWPGDWRIVSHFYTPSYFMQEKKRFTTQWHKIDLFWQCCYRTLHSGIKLIYFNSAVTAGLGNIVSQKIVKRGKGELVDYRPVVAFSTFG